MSWIRSVGLVLLATVATVPQAQESGWRANPDVVGKASQDQATFNYEEARVAGYTLPDPLTLNGAPVTSRDRWPSRRAEILELFRANVYGRRPGRAAQQRFDIVEEQARAMNGAATMKRIAVVSTQAGREHRFELLLFLPNARAGAAPVFLLLNNRPVSNTDPTRKQISPFWPAEEMIARGFGIAAVQNNELAPDVNETFRNGAIRLFEGERTERAADAWGAIAAWSWGASRVMDYFETDARVDKTRVAVVGHSRGGKASLWAGAEDERFALVVSNESGEGGAALSRRAFGETTERINTAFPHWFTATYKTFNGRERELPIDQHMLLALVAPRPLYVASADQDLWSDPRGEFLSLAHTSPVYALWGEPAIGEQAMTALDSPLIVGRRGYHVRTGAHNLTSYDWARFADFAERVWK